MTVPSFQELFLASRGQPVEYRGQVIQLVDRVPVNYGDVIQVVFETTASEWRQGVHLSVDSGTFEVNGRTIKKAVVLWHDTAPRSVVLKVDSKNGEYFVKNVWDTGNGLMQFWHNGAAIIVEHLGSARRYRCNDGRADDDFDDLVFSIQPFSQS